MSPNRRNAQPTSDFPYASGDQNRWRRHLRRYQPDLSQRLSRARLVYLRRHDARWGWLALCLFLFLQPDVGFAQDLNNPGAGTLMLGSQENPFIAPAVSHELTATVSGPLARVEVTQHFINPSDEWIEGRYLFPLPDDAAVDRLLITIGDRTIEGQIKEKQTARREYQKAKSEGRRAGVVEQKRANLFSLALANIGPGEEITVRLSYLETLDYRDGEYSIRLPMTVMPRFTPAASVVDLAGPLAVSLNPISFVFDTQEDRLDTPYVNGLLASTAEIEIRLLGDRWPQAIRSSSHVLNIDRRASEVSVLVDGGYAAMDRDFELSWQPASGAQPDLLMLSEQWQGTDYALLMFLPPSVNQVQVLPRELIIVIDTSGSMHGESIQQARAAVDRALQSLAPGDLFNLIQFNSHAEALFSASVLADPDNVTLARRYTHRLIADGGTNMAPALGIALGARENPGYLRQVVFITDGAVGNEAQLLAKIEKELGNSRLFTVGIGPAPNSWFMKKAARFGRGTHTYINNVGKVGEKMAALLSRLEKPALKNVRIHWPADIAVEQWPEKIPDLYAGEPMIVSAKLSRLPDQVLISGDGGAGYWAMQKPVPAKQDAPGVAALWARHKIESLQDLAIASGDRDAARGEITSVALEFGLISRYTSLLAVESTPVRPTGTRLASLQIANVMPRNLASPGFPNTASPAALWRWAGFALLLLGVTWLTLDKRRVFA
ncbi:MAG: marine proteobacterial sortase target protein [Gammaproteobacteria bacterium]|nr:marine proteobacterial sortase target protein [Gammaproteobacteria bacterium]